MPDTGAPYFIPFLDGTELVRAYPDLSEDLADAIVNALENIPVTQKKIEAFTGTGSWTVPAGVTYAIAHMLGGGGGTGKLTTAGNGSTSSVAFASGTVQSLGGRKGVAANPSSSGNNQAGLANTGRGATVTLASGNLLVPSNEGGDSTYTVAGAPVTPGASITVTVGAGGTAGTAGAAGGSGYVYIEYYEEV